MHQSAKSLECSSGGSSLRVDNSIKGGEEGEEREEEVGGMGDGSRPE